MVGYKKTEPCRIEAAKKATYGAMLGWHSVLVFTEIATFTSAFCSSLILLGDG